METLKDLAAQLRQAIAHNPNLIWGLALAIGGLLLIMRTVEALARGSKTCPSCQKVVPAQETSCRYCRHSFPGADSP